MRPTLKPTLNLASVSFAAAVLLISCGPAIGETDGGSGTVTSGASTAGASTNTTSTSGGTGTGTTGSDSDTTETGTRLPPPMGGTSSNPNDCDGVTTFGNSCSPNVGWCNYAKAELGNNCVGCHGEYRYLANVNANSAKVESDIVNKTMPKGSSGLPAADISKIKTWIDCGLPK